MQKETLKVQIPHFGLGNHLYYMIGCKERC